MSEMLKNAVTVIDGRAVTTSMKIAEIFGKQHKHVLDSIRKLEAPKEFTEPNFRLSEFTDSTGRKLPMYQITRDGFTLLAMGFTGKKAMQFKVAYIEAFNAMEAELKNGFKAQIDDLNDLKKIAVEFYGILYDFREEYDKTIEALRRTIHCYQSAAGWRIPESWREVDDFCYIEDLRHVNPKKFFAYYTERGWRIDGTPITDWKNVCRYWDLNGEEREKNALCGRA